MVINIIVCLQHPPTLFKCLDLETFRHVSIITTPPSISYYFCQLCLERQQLAQTYQIPLDILHNYVQNRVKFVYL